MEIRRTEAEELERTIDGCREYGVVALSGDIRLDIGQSGNFVVGKNYSKNVVTITKPNITIDGGGARILLDSDQALDSDLNLFYLSSRAKNVTLRNLNISVVLRSPASCRTFAAVHNTAFGLKLVDCRIEMTTQEQINLIALRNDGKIVTHMETPADNLSVTGCHFSVTCTAETFGLENEVCGIYNCLANSISVQNNYVYAKNQGTGGAHRAVGIFTDGRFGRFVGNNVKANASHNTGQLLAQAHAVGMVNEGLYTLISSNNLIGEWAGCSIGLETRGDYAKVSGNKILATHTIWGRSIRSASSNSVFDANIITSTSRNPRLIEHGGSCCLITNNYMEGLMPYWEYRSSVGIYLRGEGVRGNLIANNLIRNVCDCGIFSEDKQAARLAGNLMTTYPESAGFVETADGDNLSLRNTLDESRIEPIGG